MTFLLKSTSLGNDFQPLPANRSRKGTHSIPLLFLPFISFSLYFQFLFYACVAFPLVSLRSLHDSTTFRVFSFYVHIFRLHFSSTIYSFLFASPFLPLHSIPPFFALCSRLPFNSLLIPFFVLSSTYTSCLVCSFPFFHVLSFFIALHLLDIISTLEAAYKFQSSPQRLNSVQAFDGV